MIPMRQLLVAAACAALSLPVWALSTDRDQQIEVHADRFKGDEVQQTAVYAGNVVVDQGSMNITGAKLELSVTPKGYRKAVITGSPARFKQQRDPKTKGIDEWMHAEANRITYDEERDTVTLEGAARISRTENGVRKDQSSGERIVYNLRYARSTIEGGTTDGKKNRVSTIIAPRTKEAAEPRNQGARLSPATNLTAPK